MFAHQPRRKKRADIFAPRQSILDAKEKLGPAFFDITMLECSRNAVELTKLVKKWDDLDKAHRKVTQDIDKEQRVLRRSLKISYTEDEGDKQKTELIASKEGIETRDGKVVPPGFRFRCNGDIKPSTLALPIVSVSNEYKNLSDADDEYELDQVGRCGEAELSGPGENKKDCRIKNTYSGLCNIDYKKEITELQEVVYDLCTELAKSKLNGENYKTKTYLRKHSNDYIPQREMYEPEPSHGNKKDSQVKYGRTNLYKSQLKTPSHRQCNGCMFKLRQENNEDLLKIKKNRESQTVLKRRWSYVPSGKYVPSTSSLGSSTNLRTKSSSALLMTSSSSGQQRRAASHIGIIKDNGRKLKSSTVRFSSNDDGADVSKSKYESEKNDADSNDYETPQLKSSVYRKTQSAPDLPRRARSVHTSMTKSPKEHRLQSGSSASSNLAGGTTSCSARSSVLSSRLSARLLMDLDSRINVLKEIQAEEDERCGAKVKDFLDKYQLKTKRHRWA